MPCLPEFYYIAEIFFRNWFCLTEFDWCGSSSAFVSPEPCLENVAEKAQSRLDEILTEAA
jgi:hypothetical protein